MAGSKPAYVQVAESFWVGNDVYRVGQVFGANHPIARKFKEYFKPLVVVSEDPVEENTRVEQATAAPGEKRNA